ncbi:hypothetical protein U27_05586 [Candidatus Vecturithrix granuli]|uniref:Uncharacterized protein n=1 Tax=Vecturithrix granuli TaxID=1499967 RepID=A0A081C207_VECG1|nr:hypothetical protein U27_05586 [Candidatus Vecturithrix granuli]
MMLSAEELLAGSELTFEVEIPGDVLQPGKNDWEENPSRRTVRLRPLTIHDLQLIDRAAKESDNLVAALMVHRALVEPDMTVADIMNMHVGLMQFLLHQVNQVSGIEATSDLLSMTMEAPLAKAAFILAREFGWTPQQVNELTLGQVLLHLQMLKEKS